MDISKFDQIIKKQVSLFTVDLLEREDLSQHLWMKMLERKPTSDLTDEEAEIKIFHTFCKNELLSLKRSENAMFRKQTKQASEEISSLQYACQPCIEKSLEAKTLKDHIEKWADNKPAIIKKVIGHMINQDDAINTLLDESLALKTANQARNYNKSIISPFTVVNLCGLRRDRWIKYRENLRKYLIRQGYELQPI